MKRGRPKSTIVVEDVPVVTRECNVISNPRDIEDALRILAKLLIARAQKKVAPGGEILHQIQLDDATDTHTMGRNGGVPKQPDDIEALMASG